MDTLAEYQWSRDAAGLMPSTIDQLVKPVIDCASTTTRFRGGCSPSSWTATSPGRGSGHGRPCPRRSAASTGTSLNRFLRVTPGGLLRVDAAKITADAKLDGKYLLRTCDPHLSTEDIALGYKQLLEVERGWRDMKQVLDLRPVYHRLEDRIRAHVVLCWLALLLARIVETQAGTPDRPRPGRAPATSCSACTSARSPARPGCSARPPHPAPRSGGCTKSSTSLCRRGSSTSTPSRPQRADQAQHRRLVTRHVTRPAPVCPAQTPYSGTFTGQQLRNPGPGSGWRRCGSPMTRTICGR